jgi:integrase
LADLRALEAGCGGERPLDLRDRAIVSVLVTTAARNSSVRLLRIEDVDAERSIIAFVRAKGGKTLEVALHPETRAALLDESGYPASATSAPAMRLNRIAMPSGPRRPRSEPRSATPSRSIHRVKSAPWMKA